MMRVTSVGNLRSASLGGAPCCLVCKDFVAFGVTSKKRHGPLKGFVDNNGPVVKQACHNAFPAVVSTSFTARLEKS